MKKYKLYETNDELDYYFGEFNKTVINNYRLSEEDLRYFFSKYSLLDLDAFKQMLTYISFDYDVQLESDIINEFYYQKFYEYNNPDDTEYRISDISKKNKLLNINELLLLFLISDEAVNYLSSIKQYDVSQELSELYILINSVTKEIETKLSKKKILVRK